MSSIQWRETRVLAYAKVNLGLRILYRRPDQYHELRTIFQTISLADVLDIRFSRAKKTTISIGGKMEIADNLVERAARACLEEMRLSATVEFHLKKNIPMGAGLGGGSSDAAAVLLALPALAGRTISDPRLHALAAALGSDVPFFLYGGTVVGLGRGEELYPMQDLPSRPGLVVASGIHVSTPDAFRRLSPLLKEAEAKRTSFQLSALDPLHSPLENDFEQVVFPQHKKLKRIKDQLRKWGAAPAMMTGSGSAIFGLFHRKETIPHVVQSLEGHRVHPVTLLTGAAYRLRWLRRLRPHIEGDIWPPRSRYAR